MSVGVPGVCSVAGLIVAVAASGAICSVAASGSTAESLHRSIEAFRESCMVALALVGISGVCFVAGRVGGEHACAGISGVCSVAGRVGVESFLEVLPWSCGLFPIEQIARNAAKKDVDKPKELASTNPDSQAIGGCARQV